MEISYFSWKEMAVWSIQSPNKSSYMLFFFWLMLMLFFLHLLQFVVIQNLYGDKLCFDYPSLKSIRIHCILSNKMIETSPKMRDTLHVTEQWSMLADTSNWAILMTLLWHRWKSLVALLKISTCMSLKGIAKALFKKTKHI